MRNRLHLHDVLRRLNLEERRALQAGNESEWQVTKGCSKDNSLRQSGTGERLNHAHCGFFLDAVLNQHTPEDSHTAAMYRADDKKFNVNTIRMRVSFCIACCRHEF